MSRVCSAGWPSYAAKLLSLDITPKLCNQIFLIPTILIGTVDFYLSILLSLTLTSPAGHKIKAKQNSLASLSPTLFI